MILEVVQDFVTAGMFTFGIEVIGRALGDAWDEAKDEEKDNEGRRKFMKKDKDQDLWIGANEAFNEAWYKRQAQHLEQMLKEQKEQKTQGQPAQPTELDYVYNVRVMREGVAR
jgi:hypothetical protein